MLTPSIQSKEVMDLPPTLRKTKIIEIIGPPGIGKSTVYKSLCKQWNSQSNWIFPDKLLASRLPTEKFKFWVEYHVRRLLNKSKKTIHVDFGLRYIANNKDLANFLWKHICSIELYDDEDVCKRFRSSYYLFRDFSKYQAIWETPSDRPCIIDEGLLEKSFFVFPDEQFVKILMDEFLPMVPLPHAVIYLDTEKRDVIAERLLNRKKTIASHVSKDRHALVKDIEHWQFMFGIILNHLRKHDVPVYTIDGLQPIERQVDLIKAILK